MALTASLAALCSVAAFAFVCASFGHRLLRAAGLLIENGAAHLLCAAATGFIAFEAVLALAEFFAPVRISVLILLAAATAIGASEWSAVLGAITSIVHGIVRGQQSELLLAGIAGCVLLLEGLAATAPLTGSDALHYHFAAPLHVLRSGFHPDFFLSTSFLTGQGHLLILSGLALGSQKLAMGLLFLPGALAAAGVACLARTWVSRPWAWLAALAFLLNPVVFWQISTAGVPDLWMTFFCIAGVLLVARARDNCSLKLALVCGVLAGGVAGTKYVGCVFAAALLLAFLWESRSLKHSALFGIGALTAGIWPYARNFFWTGDPIFPFATRWLVPSSMNAYALSSLVETTVVRGQRTISALWRFPFFAAVDRENAGFWEFFGPLCLLFLPLFFLMTKRTASWRVVAILVLLGGLGVGLTSGMARYSLPVLPVALAAAFAGSAELRAREWRIAWSLSLASIVAFLLLGLGGLAVYSRPAIAASVGLVDRETYLQQRAPDYATSSFVNRALAGKGSEGLALVFFRHTYYLQVPYLNGDPQDSWAVDPARLSTPEAWREFLQSNHIRWIVRAPDYPEEIAAPLEQLEGNGSFTPFAREDVTTFEGMRILGVRRTFTATIFRVID